MSGRRIRRKPCPRTGKVAYRDRDVAEWAAEQITALRIREKVRAQQLYAYRCPFCPWWHLTHLEQWPRPLAPRDGGGVGLRRGKPSASV